MSTSRNDINPAELQTIASFVRDQLKARSVVLIVTADSNVYPIVALDPAHLGRVDLARALYGAQGAIGLSVLTANFTQTEVDVATATLADERATRGEAAAKGGA